MSYLTEEEYNTFTGLLKIVLPENIRYWNSTRVEGIRPLTQNTHIISPDLIAAMDRAADAGQKAYKDWVQTKEQYERKR